MLKGADVLEDLKTPQRWPCTVSDEVAHCYSFCIERMHASNDAAKGVNSWKWKTEVRLFIGVPTTCL